jgi:enediyne biosynthesis protein E4
MKFARHLLLSSLLLLAATAPSLLAQVRFENVTTQAGITTPDASSSSFTHSWADFDNDGYWDLFIARGDIGNFQIPQVYHNLGNGTFADITTSSFPPFQSGYYAHMCFGDFDNDGYVDVFQDAFVSAENRLWRNNGDLTFSDVSSKLINPGGRTVGTVWTDFDKDGFVDLIVNAQAGQGTLCYHNDKGQKLDQIKTFITNPPIGDILLTTDINQDGWPDYFLADHQTDDALFLSNNGVCVPFNNAFLLKKFNNSDNRMTSSFADIDGDGYPEMLLADDGKLVVWHNDSARTYTDWTSALKLGKAASGDHRMSFIQDMDNDGYLDILLYNNLDSSEIWYGSPNGFVRTTIGARMNTNAIPSSFSWTDFDNDGFLDLMDVSMGVTELWHNLGNSNRWLGVTLRGHKANSMGIGSTVIAYAHGHPQYREIGFYQGYYGYQPALAHFGFGSPGCEAESGVIDSVVIVWQPGGRQVLKNVRYNQTMLVDQDSGIVRTFERPVSAAYGYVYPQYNPTYQTRPDTIISIPLSVYFPKTTRVDTMNASTLTFAIAYNSAAIDINPTKVAQRYLPPTGWKYQSSRLVPDTLSVTIANLGSAVLSDSMYLGTLRFDTYSSAAMRSLIYLTGVQFNSQGQNVSFCTDFEGSLITAVVINDTVSTASVASACANTTDMHVIPNPSQGGRILVHFPMHDDPTASIRVLDLLGREVYAVSNMPVPSSAGTAEIVIPSGAISREGSYLVEVTTPVQRLVTRLVVTR